MVCGLATFGKPFIKRICYVMLCYVMLCYVMLCYVMLHGLLLTTSTIKLFWSFFYTDLFDIRSRVRKSKPFFSNSGKGGAQSL